MASTGTMAAASGTLGTAESSGYVEFFGYHATANGWFFTGWVTCPPDLVDRLQDVSAWFADEITPINPSSCIQIGMRRLEQNTHPVLNGDIRGEVVKAVCKRDDLPDGADGTILFLRARSGPRMVVKQSFLFCSHVETE